MRTQAYLNTRVTALSTRLLDRQQMQTLAQSSLGTLAERFGLDALLEDGVAKAARSRAVEQTLIRALLAELAILIRPMSAPERGLLLTWGSKFALFNLKTLIRGKLYQLDQSEIREHLYDLPAVLRLPNQALFQAENVPELLRVLERSPYSLIARQAREVYEQQRDPFALEAAIDQRYCAELVRRAQQFQGEDALALQQLVGGLLDRLDLLWLLRFRFSYGFSPSEAFYQLVPSPKLLHRERLLQLANLETFDQVLDALPSPLDQTLAGCGNLIEVQRRMGGYLDAEARRVLGSSRSGLARALAYLILRENDLSLLFSLIQGRLLGLPQALIEIGIDLAEPHCPMDTAA
ncbi:V-type ATPase subunit [Thiohalocapsa marina]|uniref:V-type ATPase subunit n=1 Tax=Thiohalocapsa marina TaxID=424902 RepID=A0A5M8FMN8_9GAMM|nr:V-type ATPase subunit [Thiohalocapsa marina]KAA6184956.1 V-type ATPase subunit [Thiohalocapsa marina]